MITPERFEFLRERYGDYSSWAIWESRTADEPAKARVGNLRVLDLKVNPNLLAQLNPDVVLIALNGASRGATMKRESWRNFHDPSPRANDFKIRAAFEGTPYWGAYMTDVFVNVYETKSELVSQWAKDNPKEVAAQQQRLEQELIDLGSTSPLLLVFGDDAFRYLSEEVLSSYRVIKIDHYSRYVSQIDYRENVLSQISRAGLSAPGAGCC